MWLIPKRPENTRVLDRGEIVAEGDFLRIGESWSVITPCKYDPGCCVGAEASGTVEILRTKEDAP